MKAVVLFVVAMLAGTSVFASCLLGGRSLPDSVLGGFLGFCFVPSLFLLTRPLGGERE